MIIYRKPIEVTDFNFHGSIISEEKCKAIIVERRALAKSIFTRIKKTTY